MRRNHQPQSLKTRPAEKTNVHREALFLGKRAERLSRASVVIIGLGALGSKAAHLMAASGVGELVLVDRDFVEQENLGTQEYSPNDIGAPKAVAIQDKLRRTSPDTKTRTLVEDVTPHNVEEVVKDADLVLDGTDNMQTRYLINDACRKHRVPWVFASCIKAQGMVFTVVPGAACYECIFAKPPKRVETCETAGLLNAASAVAASLQAGEAVKILTGTKPNPNLVFFDLWENVFEQARVFPRNGCPACRGDYQHLRQKAADTQVLCGDAVQVKPGREFDKSRLAETLKRSGVRLVAANPFILHFKIKNYAISVFDDGRAIIKGTADPKKARSLYAKYVGC